VVSFTPRPPYPRERAPGTHCIGGLVDPRAGLDDMEKWKFLTLPGLELRPLGRPGLEKSNDIRNRIRNLPACSIVPRRKLVKFVFMLCTFCWCNCCNARRDASLCPWSADPGNKCAARWGYGLASASHPFCETGRNRAVRLFVWKVVMSGDTDMWVRGPLTEASSSSWPVPHMQRNRCTPSRVLTNINRPKWRASRDVHRVNT
jgi:hypothetical protein